MYPGASGSVQADGPTEGDLSMQELEEHFGKSIDVKQ